MPVTIPNSGIPNNLTDVVYSGFGGVGLDPNTHQRVYFGFQTPWANTINYNQPGLTGTGLTRPTAQPQQPNQGIQSPVTAQPNPAQPVQQPAQLDPFTSWMQQQGVFPYNQAPVNQGYNPAAAGYDPSTIPNYTMEGYA